MNTWKINWRIVGALVALTGGVIGILLAQHNGAVAAGVPSPMSADAAFWLTWVVAACAVIGPALPSIFGQSSVAPPGTSERRVTEMATREALVDVLSDPQHPIRRELERVA